MKNRSSIKLWLIGALYLTWAIPGFGQSRLSEDARISLLTCSAGEELYSTFGHSALRVHDDSLRLDWVFSYGTFDFETEHFYLKFLNGKLDYMISVQRFASFIRNYEADVRGVEELVLEFTHSEKNQIWTYLQWNMQPENRFYRYDFFYDNCASRIRDVLCQAKKCNPTDSGPLALTYRDGLHKYLARSPWTQQGIDLIIGSKADCQTTGDERCFLPEYLQEYCLNQPGWVAPGGHKILLTAQNLPCKSWIMHPNLWSCLLLLVGGLLTVWELKKKFHAVLFDRILFFTIGLAGILMTYLWFFTDHEATASNLNVLWANPFWVMGAFLIGKQTKNVSLIFMGMIFLTATALVISFVYHQKLPFMAFSLSLLIILRLHRYWTNGIMTIKE